MSMIQYTGWVELKGKQGDRTLAINTSGRVVSSTVETGTESDNLRG